MDWKKFLAIPLAALLLFSTACSEQSPTGDVIPKGPTQEEEEQSNASSALEEDGMKQIGDSISYSAGGGVQMEATVQKVQVFDHYTDAGITEADCCYGVKDTPFILLDVTVKKVSGPEREGEDDWDTLGEFHLTNQEGLQLEAQGKNEVLISPEMCYFSDHRPVEKEEDEKGYNKYWLDPGEEKTYQLGWCLHDGSERGPREPNVVLLMETEGLVLAVGADVTQEQYVDLGT